MTLKALGEPKEAPIVIHRAHTLETNWKTTVIQARRQRGDRVAYDRQAAREPQPSHVIVYWATIDSAGVQ